MTNGQVYLWGAIVLIGLYLISQFAKYPGQIAWKLVKTAVAGCVAILAVNWIGGYVHYHLPLNPITAGTAGLLGIPGVAALVALQIWLYPV